MRPGLRLSILGAVACAACGPGDGPNRPPTVTGSPASTAEDTAVEVTVVASDADGDALEFRYAGASHGTVTGAAARFTYTPEADYHGTDAVTVTVLDGEAQATATISLTITPVNDAPVALDDTLAALEDTAADLPLAMLTGNDVDVDDDPLTITGFEAATDCTVTIVGDQLRLVPGAGFIGDAHFRYRVTDGTETVTANVTVNVGAVDDPPVAVDDTATTAEDVTLTVPAATLTANDSDPEGQTLGITSVGNPSHGTVGLAGGSVVFTPAADYHGPASFEYTVSDGAGTDTATVAVTVTPVPDAPVTVADTATTAEDQPLVILAATLAANDTDADGDALTVTAVGLPSGGTVALAAGTVTFTPTPNLTGTASFQYTVSDGARTATGTVAVTITPVPDAPIAGNDSAITPEDTPLVLTAAALLANDADVDGPSMSVAAVGAATNGTVALAGTTITFTPATNFAGTASFQYTVSDGTLSDVGTVTVTVTPVNDAPFAVDDAITVAEDSGATDVFVLANDGDIDGPGPLTVLDVRNAVNCTPTRLSNRVTVTPAPDFSGTATFEYRVDDGAGGLDVGLVTVNVTPVNDAPVVQAISTSTDENHAVVITLTATDLDSPMVTFTPGGASVGTVSALTPTGLLTATVTYTPPAGFTGTATFSYTAHDGLLGSTSAIVTVVVNDIATCGDGELDPGEQCDDTNATPLDGCSTSCRTETLFFSEYVEGTSNNKAIEIMNPLATAQSLVGCSVRVYANANLTPSATITLTGTVASHDVYVVCNTGIAGAPAGACDQTSGSVNWNGNDSVELFCTGVTLDAFGRYGENPAVEWGTGLTSTADNTLRRKCTITVGDLLGTDAFDPAIEWDGLAGDTLDNLGVYHCP